MKKIENTQLTNDLTILKGSKKSLSAMRGIILSLDGISDTLRNVLESSKKDKSIYKVLNIGVVKNVSNEITASNLIKAAHHFSNLLLGSYILEVQIEKALRYNLEGTVKQIKVAEKALTFALENYDYITVDGDLRTSLYASIIAKGITLATLRSRKNSLLDAIEANNVLLPKMLQK